MAQEIIEAVLSKPFAKYQAAVADIPYENDDADRELTIEFLFNTIEEVPANDNCTKVQYSCDESLDSSEVDALELIWERCSVVKMSTTPNVQDGKVINATFTIPFAQLEATNYFRLWGIKDGNKFLVSKGVLYARK